MSKLRILFLAACVLCLAAAGYLAVDYIRSDQRSERSFDTLRDMKQTAAPARTEAASAEPVPTPTPVRTDAAETKVTQSAETTDMVAESVTQTAEVTDAVAESVTQTAEAMDAVAVSVTQTAEATDAVAASVTEKADEAGSLNADDAESDTAVQTQPTPMPAETSAAQLDETVSTPQSTTASELRQTPSPDETPAAETPLPTESPRVWTTREPYVFNEDDILPEYRAMYGINPDLIGWLTIDDTVIDYPVLAPDDPDYYLSHDFYGEESMNGMLIISKQYDALTPAPVFVVHGHNMRSGKMFNEIMRYSNKSWAQKHAYIRFDTLTEHRFYQFVACFYSKVYEEGEPGFRYYLLPENEEIMKYFVHGVRESARYVFDAEDKYTMHDEYLVLSTCAYHTKNGRWVVVAKRVEEEDIPAPTDEPTKKKS